MKLPFHIRFIVDKNALYATTSVRKVLEGDVSLLVERVQAGALLSLEERDIIAKALRQEPFRPKHRAPKAETARERELVAMWIYVQKHRTGDKQEALVAQAMAKFKKSRAYVMAALAEKRADPRREELFDGMAAALASDRGVMDTEDLPIKDVPLKVTTATFPPVD